MSNANLETLFLSRTQRHCDSFESFVASLKAQLLKSLACHLRDVNFMALFGNFGNHTVKIFPLLPLCDLIISDNFAIAID